MDKQTFALWLGTILLGNLAMAWQILKFVFKKVSEYNNLQATVRKLERENEKMKKDLNAAHQKIREKNG